MCWQCCHMLLLFYSNILAPNGVFLKEGDILKQPKLARTLSSIAESGPDYFYNSSFTELMVDELANEYNSILTFEDFSNYEVVVRDVLTSKYNDLLIHGMPPPASGAVLTLIMNILESMVSINYVIIMMTIGFNFTTDDINSLTYHRIVEAMKFAFGQRLDLGDPDFNETVNKVKDYNNQTNVSPKVVEFMIDGDTAKLMRSMITDNTTHDIKYYLTKNVKYNPLSHGTSHLSVVDVEGNAVAMTTTINT